jgi:hypothetical protein
MSCLRTIYLIQTYSRERMTYSLNSIINKHCNTLSLIKLKHLVLEVLRLINFVINIKFKMTSFSKINL